MFAEIYYILDWIHIYILKKLEPALPILWVRTILNIVLTYALIKNNIIPENLDDSLGPTMNPTGQISYLSCLNNNYRQYKDLWSVHIIQVCDENASMSDRWVRYV